MALVVFGACAAAGQPTAAPSGFEVASIKPVDPAAGGGMQIGVLPSGVFTAKNVTLKALIQQAYEVRDFQVSGGPGWLDTARYDIIAKGNGAGPSEEDLGKMTDAQRNLFKEQLLTRLRALLADRFQLRVHRETRELPVYALMVAKNGTRLQVATDSPGPGSGLSMRRGEGGKSEITGTKVSVASLVKLLSSQVGRVVLDQTGLQGTCDFKMTFAPDMGPSAGDASTPGPDGPSLFTALQEQLGLRLEAQKGPVEVVVIDSAQRASEN